MKYLKIKTDQCEEVLNLEEVISFWKKEIPRVKGTVTTYPYVIQFQLSSTHDFFLQYKTKETRDSGFETITNALNNMKGNNMNIKSFAEEVKSVLPSPTQVVFFLVVVFVLDKFIFKGALREYVMSLIPQKEEVKTVSEKSAE